MYGNRNPARAKRQAVNPVFMGSAFAIAGQLCNIGFKDHPCFRQFVHGDLLDAEDGGEGFAHWLRIDFGYEDAGTRFNGQQSGGLEAFKGLPDGDATGLKPFHQFPLGRETVPGLHRATQNGVLNLPRNPLRDFSRFYGLEGDHKLV
jgi:hypothetical protein